MIFLFLHGHRGGDGGVGGVLATPQLGHGLRVSEELNSLRKGEEDPNKTS